MNKEVKIVKPGQDNLLVGENGERLTPPEGWSFLAAGDAGLTRKVTAKGMFWRVQIRKGRRKISKGVWAPAEIISAAQAEVKAVRATAEYAKRIAADRRRREKKQAEYEKEFYGQVRQFLAFSPRHSAMEKKMAELVTAHAIPVGSGTVARTAMIPIGERASRAVIAWMRHQTSAYDSMNIPRQKGKRREVRRMLASRSVQLLEAYRNGEETSQACPLKRALGLV